MSGLHHINIQKTARYYTWGELNADTTHIYIALHGYGQLASQIIRKFDQLGDTVFVIAPEGLSRFYWDEKTGQVGASWMTKEDRNEEIEDYCNFIDLVVQQYLPLKPAQAQVHLLGFSQGGATAVRWLLLRQPALNNVLLWGCDIPPDLNYKAAANYLQDKRLFWIYGDADPYLPADRVQQLEKRFTQFQLSPEIIVFKGAHELDRATLLLLHQRFSEPPTT